MLSAALAGPHCSGEDRSPDGALVGERNKAMPTFWGVLQKLHMFCCVYCE